jgi:hypothetical protein
MTSSFEGEDKARALADLVDDMLRRLGSAIEPPRAGKSMVLRATLFERCIELCKSGAVPSTDVRVRTLHHLSCTGGTLIAKCIASMPNTMVLNEVDPLSKMLFQPESPKFAPTDLAALVRMSDPAVADDMLAELFLGQLKALHKRVVLEGRRLVLRDHNHGQFLFYDEPDPKKSLLALLRPEFSACSVVTVRDPLDSYLSMRDLGWIIFSPPSLDEYARRYHLFLDAHDGLPIYRYEDFLAAPQVEMRRLCDSLGLPFNELFEETFDAFRFSGDSGRTGNVISPRPRREYDSELAKQAAQSAKYIALCRRLGYEPVGESPGPAASGRNRAKSLRKSTRK